MAKRNTKPQCTDIQPCIVNGQWLRVKDSECDGSITLIRLSKITSIMETDEGSLISAGSDERVWVADYKPDDLVKVITDAEFNAALEAAVKSE